MSTTLNNPGLEVMQETLASELVPDRQPSPPASHEALQALLAFAALHDRARQRRTQQRQSESGSESVWEIQEFALDEVLELVAERARTITGADGVAIALADGDAIICRAVAGSTVPDRGIRLQPNSGFSGACLISGETIRCNDSEADLRVSPIVCRQLGARSMVAVPLSAKQNVIGLIEAFSNEPFGFNDSDVRNLALLAELVLAALKPEDEDRLAEISRRIVHPEPVPEPAPEAVEPESSDAEVDVAESQPPENGREPQTPVLSHYESGDSSRPGLAVVFALIVFALTLGAALWWTISRHSRQPAARASQPTTATQAVQPQLPAPAPAVAELVTSPDPDDSASSQPPSLAASLATVTGIRHWSSSDSSVVAIDLGDQVQYEAHRLTNPDRIYFDLHDTRLAPAFSTRSIDIGDELLARVRAAQLTPGVVRVVLETKGSSNFSVSLEPNPYRLLVELRKIGAKPQARTKIDLFGPDNTAIASASNPAPASAVGKLRIVLDAGHGGWDLGTVGRKGLLEKDLVLDIVARLGKLVENRLHADAIFTRRDDSYVTLEKRAEIANLAKANFFLSIHANYSDYPSARGIETYFTNTYSSIKARPLDDTDPAIQNVNWTNIDIREKVRDSRRLAINIQHTLYATLASSNPGLPNRGVKEAQYVVLTGTSMPSVLTEISFVSSPTDENNLQSSTYRQRIAEALYQGVAHYVAESGRLTMAAVPAKSSSR